MKTGYNGNLYELLQVQPGADPAIIRASYKALMKLVHPDAGGNEDLAARINDAYAVLSDEERRGEYDRLLCGGPNTIGNYEILSKIGEGGFGATYKARHNIIDELVCIKHSHETSPQHRETILNETKAIWDVRHHGMPAMRDVLTLEDGSIALVMSYVPFPSLTTLIQKAGALDPEHVAWIAERCLGVLGYLHYHGIVHGDMKPDNIMVNPKNHSVVLVDFGLSTREPTRRSSNKGYTPCFAAPEQIDDLMPPSPATDFYGLGKTMIYCLDGGDLAKVQSHKVPAGTPRPLRKFISRLTAYDPENRPSWENENLVQTMGEARLEAFGRRRTNVLQIEGV